MNLELIDHAIEKLKNMANDAKFGWQDHIAQLESELEDENIFNQEKVDKLVNLSVRQVEFEDTQKIYERRISVLTKFQNWKERENEQKQRQS